MPTLRLDDIDLYYEVRGEGPRVLMCNGSGATIEASAPLIDALARQCTVAVHDQRCLGRTTIPERTPTMADYAADAAALLDHLGWDTAGVFGISFGGMVALELAVTHPERIERLALLCTSAGGAGGSSFPLHDVAHLDGAERGRVLTTVMDRRFTPEWLAEHPFEARIVADLLARQAALVDPERRRGELMQLEARRHHDVWDRLDRITAPTFIACGAHDGQAPPENSAALHSRIAGSSLHEYDGGHMFVFQDRTALPEVLTFLAG